MRSQAVRSARRLVSRWAGLLCAAWLGVAAEAGAAAGAAETAGAGPPVAGVGQPARVVLWVADAADEELLARTDGQTVDLAVALVPHRAPLSATAAGQLVAAREQLRAQDAAWVVWFVHPPGAALEVHLLQRGQAEPRVRRVERGAVGVGGRTGGRLGRSAAAEGAALIIRSSLRAGLDAAPEGEVAPGQSLAAARDGAARDGAGAGAGLQPARAPWVLGLGLGWHGVADGVSPAGQHAVGVRVTAGRGRLSLALDLSLGLGARLLDERTAVDLHRHGVWVGGAYTHPLASRLQLLVGAGAGVVVYDRATAVLAGGAGVVAAPARLSSALVLAPEARLRVLLHRAAWAALLLEVGVGADVVLPVLELGYQVGDQVVSRGVLWPVQPRGAVGLAVDLDLRRRGRGP